MMTLFFFSTSMADAAKGAPRGEDEVKAAFILNFLLLTEWPDELENNGHTEIVLCVVGDTFLSRAFRALNGKKVGRKTLKVIAKGRETSLPVCQAVFFRKAVSTEDLIRSLKAVHSRPVLAIGEDPKVTKLGGAIHFYTDNDRLRFAINPEVVFRQGLKMSSRLLQIATLIHE